MEFNSIKIKDTNIELIDGDRGKNYPKNHEMMDSGHTLFLNNKNIAKNFLDDSFGNFITEDKSDSLKKGKLCRNDIVLSTRGSVGNVGFYHSKIQMNHIRINSGMIILRNNDKKFLDEYLYIFLRSPYMQNKFKEFISGSVQNHLPIRDLQQIEIMYPPIYYQSYIIKIIMNIEEKIKINNQIIANLQELSQTLFKRWFVDFEFPDENGNPYKSSGGEMVDSELGEIPKGWNVKNLDDIANYVNGLAMQKFKPTDNENSLPVVKIKELKNGSTDENSNRCTSEIPDKALINDGDIIFSWSATLLVKMWCGGKAGLNQHLFKVSSDKYPKWFYYYWTKRYIDYFIGIANDKATTMGHINRKHLSHAKILIPNDSTLEKFSRTFDDLLEKELSVSKESKRLIELRDTLLPKLMSGEIEIPDDIEVNEDELSI